MFEISSYKKRFDSNKVVINTVGKYPYIVRMSSNNGRKGFIDEDEVYLNEANTISFGQDTATMFYQEKPYFTGDKIKILKARFPEFNKQNVHFFITAMQKPFSVFSWGSSSFSVEVVKSQKIKLPITEDNKIDFALMESLTVAIQKLIIKDVVEYSDRKIKATKEVVSKR